MGLAIQGIGNNVESKNLNISKVIHKNKNTEESCFSNSEANFSLEKSQESEDLKTLRELEELLKLAKKKNDNLKVLLKKITDTMKIAPDKKGNYSNYKVAIIDTFTDVDGNVDMSTFNFPHGVIVQKYITENLPGVQIDRIDINKTQRNLKGTEALYTILEKIYNGEKYDAINISQSFMTAVDLKDLKVKSKGKDIQITPENIKKYIKEVKKAYKSKFIYDCCKLANNTPQADKDLANFIDLIFEEMDFVEKVINHIAKKGVKIYISNNNECATKICYSDLIDINPKYKNCNNPNIITVSSNDNPINTSVLSDRRECSIYKPAYLEKGIDITDDGIVDIYYDKYGFFNEDLGLVEISGTSFATPTALAKDLKEEADKKAARQDNILKSHFFTKKTGNW